MSVRASAISRQSGEALKAGGANSKALETTPIVELPDPYDLTEGLQQIERHPTPSAELESGPSRTTFAVPTEHALLAPSMLGVLPVNMAPIDMVV